VTQSTPQLSFVSADAVRDVLNWKAVIDGLKAAYSLPHGPRVSPPRTLALEDKSWLRSLIAIPPGARFMGGKLFGAGASPAFNYLITLAEQDTGAIRAFVDGAFVTSFRTASTSAAALDHIADDEPLTLGLIGSGQEAMAHAQAINAIRPIREVRVYSPTPASRERFAKTFTDETGVPVVPCATPQDAVRPATVVVAAARSRDESPILYGDWLDNAKVVVSIGSTVPSQREIDVSVVDACDFIVCDVLEEVLHETGDMIAAREAGLEFDHKAVSLNALLMGQAEDQLKAAKLPMFKSVGAGIQDVVCAEMVYRLAEEAGKLIPLPIEFYTKS